MKHRQVLVTVISVGVLIGSMVGPASASRSHQRGLVRVAHTRDTGCANGLICWWDQDDFQGDKCTLDASDAAGLGYLSLGGTPCNEMMASWKNNSNLDARWSPQYDGGGTTHCMNANGQSASVAPNRDTMSSIKVYTSGNHC
jgi:hypothetical protein